MLRSQSSPSRSATQSRAPTLKGRLSGVMLAALGAERTRGGIGYVPQAAQRHVDQLDNLITGGHHQEVKAVIGAPLTAVAEHGPFAPAPGETEDGDTAIFAKARFD